MTFVLKIFTSFLIVSEEVSLSPDGTQALQLFSRCICKYIIGKGSLARKADAVEFTPVIWLETMINHLHLHL